jgi:uncharacterized metal-binding protein YceD (DUF177 family)
VTANEFSRLQAVDALSEAPRRLDLAADEGERSALARRFGLIAINRLHAEVALSRHGEEVIAEGTLDAAVTQACIATGEPVPAEVRAPFEIRFRPAPDATAPGEEVELDDADMDIVFYAGGAVDVGEAVAETLLLNLDPYPRAPGAEAALKAAGVKSEEESSPFGALAGLGEMLKK